MNKTPSNLRHHFAALIFLLAIPSAFSQTVFHQDFTSGQTVSAFIGSGKNLFDDIASSGPEFKWHISDSSLIGEATSNVGAIVRSTPLPTESGGIFQFDIDVLNIGEASGGSPITFLVGSGLAPGIENDPFSVINCRFNIYLNPEKDGYTVRDVQNDSNFKTIFKGSNRITVVVNNTETARHYSTPEDQTGTVEPNTWDLWVGNTLVFDDAKATTAGVKPVNFKIRWSASVETAAEQ